MTPKVWWYYIRQLLYLLQEFESICSVVEVVVVIKVVALEGI
jgi:hypothetical protein